MIGAELADKDRQLADAMDDADLPDERTAVVNVAELRRSAYPDEPDRHVLVRMDGTSVGQLFALETPEFKLGRHTTSDIMLEDDGVSRRHARLLREDDGYVLEDLGSANGTFVQGEKVARHRLHDGDVFQLGPNVMFRYAYTDASQQRMLQKLYEASVRDALTGAYNREHFDERLRTEIAYAKRHGTQVSLIMFDLDHFKQVNDTYGHPAGDAVLVNIAQKVTGGLRSEDVFARYGGEEFAVILRDIDIAGAECVAERLRERVAATPALFDSLKIPVTMSVGCATLVELVEPTPQALVAMADRRLYAAKRNGRNQVIARG
jgi:two-component system, cell cycle response regulator